MISLTELLTSLANSNTFTVTQGHTQLVTKATINMFFHLVCVLECMCGCADDIKSIEREKEGLSGRANERKNK